MAFAFKADIGSGTSKSSASSIAITTNTAIAIGDTVIVDYVGSTTTSAVSSVTDTAGNTYTVLADYAGTQASRVAVAACQATAAMAVGGTITVNLAAASGIRGASAHTYTGGTITQDVTAVTGSGNSTSPSVGPTATTTQAATMTFAVFGVSQGASTVSFSAGTGYTPLNGASTSGGSTNRASEPEHKINAATGTQTANGTLSPSAFPWDGVAVVLRAAASGPTTVSSSDSGTMTDAVSGVALSTADTGALTDTPGPIALSVSDAGALTDTPGPIALSTADSGALSEGTALTQLTSISASDSAALTEQTSVVPITQPGVVDVRGYTDRDDDPRWRYWWLQEPVRQRERAEPVEPEPLRRRRQKVNIDAELRPRPVDEAEELLLLGVL
jgi:hypothetical protein